MRRTGKTHKAARVILTSALVLMMALSLAACGGRGVSVDTSMFGQGGGTGTTGTGGTSGQPDTSGQSFEQLLASGAAVQYERAMLYDQQLGCEVARTLMPAGWQAGGEVMWNGQSGKYPAVVHFRITEPNDRAVIGYISGCAYAQPDPNYMQWTPGQRVDGSLAQGKVRVSPSDYNLEILSSLFPGVSAQVSETNYPEGQVAQSLEAMRRQEQELADALIAQIAPGLANTGATLSTRVSVEAVESVFVLDVNGMRCKAKIFSCQIIDSDSLVGQYGWNQNDIRWFVPFALYYIAEESVYDSFEQEACSLFMDNFVPNQQWSLALQQASEQLFQDEANRQAAQWEQTQQLIQQQAAANSAMMQQNYSSSSASSVNSSVMDGWTNVLTDQEYYSTSDGGYASLDSSYSHTYSDGNGFVQSNDPLDMPYGWNEVNSVGTMLPG
jgi:hypothetical protein